MRSFILLASIVGAIEAPAFAVEVPAPIATQSINCPENGERACARLKLLRNLFGRGARTVPLTAGTNAGSPVELREPPTRYPCLNPARSGLRQSVDAYDDPNL